MADRGPKKASRRTSFMTVRRRTVSVTLIRVEKIVLTCERILFIVVVCAATGCAMKLGKQPRQEVASLYSAQSPEFRQAAGSLLGPNFVDGNSISTLVNGDEIFPAMLTAIRSAKRSINFETYIFWDGDIAKQFTAALSERAHAGVAVNLILDAQGTQKMGLANRAKLS